MQLIGLKIVIQAKPLGPSKQEIFRKAPLKILSSQWGNYGVLDARKG